MRSPAHRWNDYVIGQVRKEHDKHWPNRLMRAAEIMSLYNKTGDPPSLGLLLTAIGKAAEYERKQGRPIENLYVFLLAMLKRWKWSDEDKLAAKIIDGQHQRWFIGSVDTEFNKMLREIGEKFGA